MPQVLELLAGNVHDRQLGFALAEGDAGVCGQCCGSELNPGGDCLWCAEVHLGHVASGGRSGVAQLEADVQPAVASATDLDV
jgi:hypothetical protein